VTHDEEKEMADFLRASAANIDQAPEADTRRRYTQFMEACQARTQRQALNKQTDMDAYAEARDKDLADYKRAERAEACGDLYTAAEWYRKAADNDLADAALRLAEVLACIAERDSSMPGSRAAASELRRVVEEASQWYITALMAGDIELDEWEIRHERLLSCLDPSKPSSRPVLTVAASTEEPQRNGPRPYPELLSLASADDEHRLPASGQLDPTPDPQSRR
jgi:hypothetical protein